MLFEEQKEKMGFWRKEEQVEDRQNHESTEGGKTPLVFPSRLLQLHFWYFGSKHVP